MRQILSISVVCFEKLDGSEINQAIKALMNLLKLHEFLLNKHLKPQTSVFFFQLHELSKKGVWNSGSSDESEAFNGIFAAEE